MDINNHKNNKFSCLLSNYESFDNDVKFYIKNIQVDVDVQKIKELIEINNNKQLLVIFQYKEICYIDRISDICVYFRNETE